LGSFLDTLLGIQNVKILGIEENRFRTWRNKQIHSLNVAMDSEKLFVGLDSFLTTLHFFSLNDILIQSTEEFTDEKRLIRRKSTK